MQTRTLIDLTRPLDDSLVIYRSGDYCDPSFKCSEWCSVAEQGFRVSRLELGTQTGTHIDAPAHFIDGGMPLDSLPLERLLGPYFLVDLPRRCDRKTVEDRLAAYCDEPILFLRTALGEPCHLTRDALEALIELPSQVWVLAGAAAMENAPEFQFNLLLAKEGKFLVEDVDEAAAATVPQRGEFIALPLRLIGASGSPCRAVVCASPNES
jgi:arylformamidase